jgi:hydroxymethylbilane synthase
VISGDPIRLGTRGSALAMTQTRWVARELEARGDRPVEIVTIRTTGDSILDRPLPEIGGKGLFTRELDHALLEGEIDLAVHSLKDLPTEFPEGLVLAVVPEREDPRDVLVGPEGRPTSLESLLAGARVGTSSLRRRALALAFRPDLIVDDIRGNLDTRLRKVDGGDFDAAILAAAGLERMGWTHRISEYLDPGGWPPAPGQGALALVTRTGETDRFPGLQALAHAPSRAAVTAERTVLHRLEAGCRLPVAALGIPFGGGLRLRGLVASPDGRRVVRAEGTGTQDDPAALGEQVAEQPVHRERVVAHHLDVRAELAQLLREVVGERVVVVDDQHPGRRLGHGSPPDEVTAQLVTIELTVLVLWQFVHQGDAVGHRIALSRYDQGVPAQDGSSEL